MGTVRRPNRSAFATGISFTATNYTDLTTVVAPTAPEGSLAQVFNSQGIWPINRRLKGIYIFESGTWVYGNQETQDRLAAKVDSVVAGINMSVDVTDPLNPIVNGVYGSEFNYIEDETDSTNATDVEQSKLKLTTGTLPAGTYRCQFTAELENSSTAGQVELIVKVDGNEVNRIIKEPKDFSDIINWNTFRVFPFTSGIHTLEIFFANQGTGTSTIRKTRIELFRVS